jgi:hypothetical protein
MNFVVIGTDHRAQPSDCGLDALIAALLDRTHHEPLVAIAEEWDETKGQSICQRLADERKLCWYNPDLTTEEKREAGILDEQIARRKLRGTFRVPSDEVREAAWASKLSQPEPGTTFVICGYLHFDSLVRKLREKGNFVETRVYLPTVPEIKDLSSADLEMEIARASSMN